MEVLAFVGVIAALVLTGAVALKVSFWILAFVVLPVLWLWMLVDAIVRPAEDYPSGTTNEKILWIVLIVVVQVAAAVYWLVVHRAARGRVSPPSVSAPPAAEASPPATVAPMAPSPPSA